MKKNYESEEKFDDNFVDFVSDFLNFQKKNV